MCLAYRTLDHAQWLKFQWWIIKIFNKTLVTESWYLSSEFDNINSANE